jgi:hypothetical protein
MFKETKQRDLYAKDLWTTKYKMRVVKSKKAYNRQREKLDAKRVYDFE